MAHEERIAQLMHSSNNCTHMLHAIDRKLAEAVESLDAGKVDKCRQILDLLKIALPEAISMLRPAGDD